MSQARAGIDKGSGPPSATSSRAPSADPQRASSPAERTADAQLDAQEKAALGFSAAAVTLKPSPSAKVPPQLLKRALEASSGGSSANLSRAKRPKTIKFSPAKAHNRAGKVHVPSRLTATSEHPHVDEDHCVACGHEGRLLICDSCNLGYHFHCLNPPIAQEETPKDAFYCKPCEAQLTSHKKHTQPFFGPLLDRLDLNPPRTFRPPKFILDSFENIAANSHGEYTNPAVFKPPRLNKAGFTEPLDPFKLKDRQGRFAHCFACRGAASASEQKRIVACDFCDKHWHLDCLDPPLTVLPYSQSGRKWMCPLHVEHSMPPMRTLRPERTVRVPQRNVANNGNVSVIPRDRPKRRRAQWEEQLHRGIRYQVPEDTLILDFWAKVRDPDRKIMNQRRLARQLGEHEDGEASDSSDLTSLDSSDSESEQPNRAAKQSNAKTKAPAPLTLTREAQGTASASTPGPAAAAAAAAAARMVKPQHSPLPVDEHNTSGTPSVAGSEGDVQSAPVPSTSLETMPVNNHETPRPSSVIGNSTERRQLRSQPRTTRRSAAQQKAAEPISEPTKASPQQAPTAPPSSTSNSAMSDEPHPAAAAVVSQNGQISTSASGSSSRGPGSQLKVRLSFPTKDRESTPSTLAEDHPAQKRARLADEAEAKPELATVTTTLDLESGKPTVPDDVDDYRADAAFSVQNADHLKDLVKARRILRDAGYADQQDNLFRFLFTDRPEVPQVEGLKRVPGWDVPWGS